MTKLSLSPSVKATVVFFVLLGALPVSAAIILSVDDVQGGNIIGTTPLNDDTWYHVAVTLEDDSSPDITEAKLYVDGQLETISALAVEPVNTGSVENVQIGTYFAAGSPRWFQGLIDDVWIYDEALSQEEIQAVMAAE